MRRFFHFAFLNVLSILVLTCMLPMPGRADLIREPVWAGKFYPASRTGLTQAIEQLTLKAQKTKVERFSGKALKALILPHAGYIYSGWTAAHASHLLAEKQFSKVVLLGPDHRVGFRNGAISDAKAWETPLGLTRLHADAENLRKRSDRFQAIPASDRTEHSLEVVLPFLQFYLKDFELVPVVIGRGDAESLASDIDSVLDEGTLLVVSSDLSHYLPYETAVARDKETIRLILDRATEKLERRENSACGKIPILVALNLARRHGWQPVLIHYANSGDTAGTKDKVVGYAAIAFWGDTMKKEQTKQQSFTDENGLALIRLARRTIMERLGQKTDDGSEAAAGLADPRFDDRLGTFVTLKIDGQLRGCIGSLAPVESLREGVRRNAVNAAFRDPRFAPLSAGELDRVEIEVSILTEPQPLAFRDSDELLARLRVNVDGVIIRKGGASATFLPQVWEQLPRPEEFLSRLCMKAGLSMDAWKHPGLDVLTYQVQYFEEHR